MIPHTKVFVGSLPPGSKPEELRRLFENYGVVTECDIMNRCGFVHMETQEMAENAIRALHNTSFKGATISVEPGRMKDRGGPRQSVGSGMNDGARGGGRSRMGRGGMTGGGGMRRGGGAGGSGGGFAGPRGDGGVPRGGFGGQSVSGGVMRGGRGGQMAGGPIRRDRGFPHQRGGPYNRSVGGAIGGMGGASNFDKWQSGGGPKGSSRNFDDTNNSYNGPQGGMGSGTNIGTNDRFNSGGYGMGNQDRRGFALPENRQMYDNDLGGQNRAPMMSANTGGVGRGGFRGGDSGFERRQGGFNNGGRTGPAGGGNMMSGGIGGGGRGGFNRGGGSIGGGTGSGGNNYNQSFPPLGGGGGNRNGPRRDMPNRRY